MAGSRCTEPAETRALLLGEPPELRSDRETVPSDPKRAGAGCKTRD